MEERTAGAGRWLRIRAGVAIGAVLLAFVLLAGRLARFQVADAEEYKRLAEQQQIVTRQLSAQRGAVCDRNGQKLAVSRRRWSVCADPKTVPSAATTAAVLAHLLDIDRDALEQNLGKDCYFVWVKRQVTDAQAEQVHKLGLRGVFLRAESKRVYPRGRLAAHVVGFTDVDGKGLAGIELRLDPLLRGTAGWETVLCDGARRIMRAQAGSPRQDAFDGYDVDLTLDLDIQDVAEKELAAAVEEHDPECAAAVVMDVRTGSVLAMASWPTFNPQAPAGSPIANQRNVAICDAYEFGSAFKPIVAAVALQDGAVTPATQFDCHGGEWRIGRRTLHDAHEFGVLSVRDIIAHSSNIGMAQVSMLMGLDHLYAGVRSFGFGEPTGVALPGEVGGILRPYRSWNDYSVVSISFGQEIAVTALSMVRAFAALANGGVLLQPRIIERVRHSSTGQVIYEAAGPAVVGNPIDSTAAQQVLEMLRLTVTDGTGRRAQDDDYALAGKTGTAQLLCDDGRGYAEHRYLSSFVGVGPVPDCRIAVLVTLKDPSKNGYYGSTCAAPAVRRIAVEALRCLRVPPARPILASTQPQ